LVPVKGESIFERWEKIKVERILERETSGGWGWGGGGGRAIKRKGTTETAKKRGRWRRGHDGRDERKNKKEKMTERKLRGRGRRERTKGVRGRESIGNEGRLTQCKKWRE
jgi:hypothetical protein